MLNVACDSKSIRFPAHAHFGFAPPPRLFVRPVVNHLERLAARSLVRRMYAWRGYLTDDIPWHSDNPNLIALGAWKDDELVATLALGRDSHQGLLSESLYAEEIGRLRRKDRKICELSQFAIDSEHGSRKLMSMLFASAHRYARSIFGATDAVIEVNPRHSRFYEREFGFKQIGDLRICPRVDAPAVLMHYAHTEALS